MLLVVANHAKYPLFSGGYIGVDVFFVISGYLITSVILNRTQDNSFSLQDFYLRRIRRILPALLFTLSICLPVAYWIMLPNELVDFGKAAVGAVFFYSNVVLWRQGGYFDLTSDLRPLLHLWSLAVEEQFYLGFPLVLLICRRLRTHVLAISLWALLVGSLLLMLALHIDMPRASFYLLPTRAWEILVGAIVAIGGRGSEYQKTNPIWTRAAPNIGIVMILGSALILDQTTRFPGVATIPSVAGTALVLIGRSSRTWTSFLLNWRPIQIVGLASFSIYLWHQPLLVVGRLLSADYLSDRQRDGIVLLTVTLGVATWHFIEKPFRNPARVRTRTVITTVVTFSCLVSAIGVFFVRNQGFEERLPPNLPTNSEKLNRESMFAGDADGWTRGELLQFRTFGDLSGIRSVFLVGDSHADALLPYLNQEFQRLKIRGVRVELSGCSPIPGSYRSDEVPEDLTFCERVHEKLRATIRVSRASTILSLRWTSRLFPIPGEITRLAATNSEGGHESIDYREYVIADSKGVTTSAERKRLALTQLFDGLLEASDTLYLIGPVPEIAWNINRINFSYYRARGEVLSQLSIPKSDFETRSHFINLVIDDFRGQSSNSKLRIISPADILCDTFIPGRCVAQWEGIPFYMDDNHLSDDGAEVLLGSVEWE